jgi:hypothetical protein
MRQAVPAMIIIKQQPVTALQCLSTAPVPQQLVDWTRTCFSSLLHEKFSATSAWQLLHLPPLFLLLLL